MSRTYKDTKIQHCGPEAQWLYGTEVIEYTYSIPYPWNNEVDSYTGRVRVDIAGAKVKRKRSFLRKFRKSPSWFTRMCMTSPKRVECRKWAREIVSGGELDTLCPDYGSKPDMYFY